jgi:hypothetical protein
MAIGLENILWRTARRHVHTLGSGLNPVPYSEFEVIDSSNQLYLFPVLESMGLAIHEFVLQ